MISKDEMSNRLEIVINYMNDQQALPFPLAIAVKTFMPQIDEALAEEENRQSLLNILSLMAWSIGYEAIYQVEHKNIQ